MCKAPYKELGKQVKAARLRKGLTQYQLADLVGTSQYSIWKLEIGKRFNIDYFEMLKLQEVLGVEIEKPTFDKVG